MTSTPPAPFEEPSALELDQEQNGGAVNHDVRQDARDSGVDDDEKVDGHVPVPEVPRVGYAIPMLIIEFGVMWLILFSTSRPVAAVYPFLFLYAIPLSYQVYKSRDLIHYSAPAATFAFGFVPGNVAIWFANVFLFAIFSVIFRGLGVDTAPDTVREERDTGWIFFWLVVAFGVFAVTTEGGKYLVLQYSRLLWEDALEAKGSVYMTVSGALGFSIMNNSILLLLNSQYQKWDIATTFGWAIYYSLVMDSVHCLTAYYIAIMVVRKQIFRHQISTAGILGIPIFARGALVFCSSPIPAFMGGYVEWTAILLVDVVIIGGLIFFVKQVQSALPRSHIERGGYFHILGTGSDGDFERELELDGIGEEVQQSQDEQ